MALDLHVLWFVLVGVLLGGYAVLDGFDLGVGIVHPFIRGDTERRIAVNAIGPLWDGNEVWLVTLGGALFAAFPEAYATVFSGFYLPFMFLLLALIGRAVSIEFRSKVDRRAWRLYWDASFSFSSLVAVFLFGLALGNLIQGIPVGADKEFAGSLSDLLGPYPIAVAVLAVAACGMHGVFYLYLKTEGPLQARIGRWRGKAFGLFLIAYLAVTLMTLASVHRVVGNFERAPFAWVVVGLTVLAIAGIPRAISKEQPGFGFVCSCATILGLIFTFGMSMFPSLVVSSLDRSYDLTIRNAASSEATLELMAIIAGIGMPFVLTYTGLVYWVFRGKTKLDEFSY